MVTNISQIYKSYQFLQCPAMRQAMENHIANKEFSVLPSELFFAKEKMNGLVLVLKQVWFWLRCVFSSEVRTRFANGCKLIEKRFCKAFEAQQPEKSIEKQEVQQKWQATGQKVLHALKTERSNESWKKLLEEYTQEKNALHKACSKNDVDQKALMVEMEALSSKIQEFNPTKHKDGIIELKAEVALEEIKLWDLKRQKKQVDESWSEYAKGLCENAGSGMFSYFASGISKVAQLCLGSPQATALDKQIEEATKLIADLNEKLLAAEKTFDEIACNNENNLLSRLSLNHKLTLLQKSRILLEQQKATVESKIVSIQKKIAQI